MDEDNNDADNTYEEEENDYTSESDEEEVPDEEKLIDYEEMKRDLELFQNADIVKGALSDDVDLIQYGHKIENDLAMASKSSIADYVNESVNFAKLHGQIEECDSILAEMQTLLHSYQKDLSGVAGEIRTLQGESVVISQKLENRREIDGILRGFINKIAVNPNMVKVLMEGEINEEYANTLHRFDIQLDYVEENTENEDVHLSTGDVKAIKEVKNDLNILKTQCGGRVKDFILEKIKQITSESDLKEIQEQSLLSLKDVMLFLKKHVNKSYEEIKRQYTALVKEYILNKIKQHNESLQPHEMVVGSAEEPMIHTQNIVRSFLKKKSQKSLKEYGVEGFALGDRYDVLKDIEQPSIAVEPLQEGDDADMDILVCYRSLCRMMMDFSLSEYTFVKAFFCCEDTSIFMDIFKDSIKYFQTTTMEWVNTSHDIFGVLLYAMLIQAMLTQLQSSDYPILIDMWLPLRDSVMKRFGAVVDRHTSSMKTGQSQTKSIDSGSEIHYSIKRYTEVVCGCYYLGNTYKDLLLEREKWEKPINSLTDETAALIEKLSEKLNEDEQNDYVLKNCCFILESLKKKGVTVENGISALFDERVAIFVNEMMSEHMTFLYDFVQKNEKKKGSQLKLSSAEMKGLKSYKDTYKTDISETNKGIKEHIKWYGLEVYKVFVKQLTDYHTKYIQILGGTSFVKELIPVKHVVNEAMKYSEEYEYVCLL